MSLKHQLLQNFHSDIKRAQNSYFKKRYLNKRFNTILWKTLSVLNFLATRETIPMILKLFIHFDLNPLGTQLKYQLKMFSRLVICVIDFHNVCTCIVKVLNPLEFKMKKRRFLFKIYSITIMQNIAFGSYLVIREHYKNRNHKKYGNFISWLMF